MTKPSTNTHLKINPKELVMKLFKTETPIAAVQRIGAELAATQDRVTSARAEASGMTDAVARRSILMAMSEDKEDVEILEQQFEFAKRAVAEEQEAAAEKADKDRRENDAAIDLKIAADAPEVLHTFMTAAHQLKEWAERSAPRVPEGSSLLYWTSAVLVDPVDVVTVIAALHRDRARDVLSGRVSPLGVPLAARPQARVPAERDPTVSVFTIKKIKWHANANAPGWTTSHAMVDLATLPAAVAARALELGAAIDPADPTAKEQRPNRKAAFPPPHSDDHCIDCDPIGFVPAKGKPLPRSGAAVSTSFDPFTPLDRGPAYTASINNGSQPFRCAL